MFIKLPRPENNFVSEDKIHAIWVHVPYIGHKGKHWTLNMKKVLMLPHKSVLTLYNWKWKLNNISVHSPVATHQLKWLQDKLNINITDNSERKKLP